LDSREAGAENLHAAKACVPRVSLALRAHPERRRAAALQTGGDPGGEKRARAAAGGIDTPADAPTGAVTAAYLYDAWGNNRELDVTDPANPGNPFVDATPDLGPDGLYAWEYYLADIQSAYDPRLDLIELSLESLASSPDPLDPDSTPIDSSLEPRGLEPPHLHRPRVRSRNRPLLLQSPFF